MEDNKIKNKRLKRGRFNVLDLVIIIVIVFVAVVAVMLTIPAIQEKMELGQKVRISYNVVFYDVDETVFDKIAEGQAVTDLTNGIPLGAVSEPPEAEPTYTYVLDDTSNEVKKQEVSTGNRNVTVTVEADAVYIEGKGYTIDGYRIAVGKEMDLRFPDYNGAGCCVGITVLG